MAYIDSTDNARLDKAVLTPMRKQYHEIRAQYPGCLLFYRLGDFYELFDEDAITVHRELNLTLTTRDRNKPEAERTPMCGVPFHAADTYLGRLIAKGYRVAICEQMEDPAKAKGLVKREVVRVVTPGTLIEENLLEGEKNNFLATLCVEETGVGLALADISTGQAYLTSFPYGDWQRQAISELVRFAPRELLLSPKACQGSFSKLLAEKLPDCLPGEPSQDYFDPGQARKVAKEQFPRVWPVLATQPAQALQAAEALVCYLKKTQKPLNRWGYYLNNLICYTVGEGMGLDPAARRNLELTESLQGRGKQGSLLGVLDRTRTPMGGRLLRSWIERPLTDPLPISRRLQAVAWLVDHPVERGELTELLRKIPDLERVMARIGYGTAGGRELRSLAAGLAVIPQLSPLLPETPQLLAKLREALTGLPELVQRIDETLAEEPPVSVREGGVIRPGFDAQVDRLRSLLTDTQGIMAQMEAEEKERTGIKNLKIGYNKVFGYYIEVSKTNYDKVPQNYVRKQTLTNCERYITQELKDMEHTILSARERGQALEYELFCALREAVAAQTQAVQDQAAAVARLDTLASLAAAAEENRYCMPVVDTSDRLDIVEGRHPVVETMLTDSLFVPNDTHMDRRENLAVILTGPNMAGKSTYMRQTALIVLMAQMGSFVPAQSARIGVVDKIFTRIGASDDLAGGKSTFMVEMTEVAEILNQATGRSLLILDEIGRGTSTYDGMAIARAVLEWCADPKHLGARTLFATHYHELAVLESQMPGVNNYNILVRKTKDDIIFLRRVARGGASRSYGVEVASLAGLPKTLVNRAKKILADLEKDVPSYWDAKGAKEAQPQLSLTSLEEQDVLTTLRAIQPENLSPREALDLLYTLKEKL